MKQTIPGCAVRSARSADLEACNDLSRQVLGFERGKEFAQAIQRNTALVTVALAALAANASSVALVIPQRRRTSTCRR
jgi:hypothetical protein